MERPIKLSRRDFLKAAVFVSTSAALAACRQAGIIAPTPSKIRTPVPTWTLPFEEATTQTPVPSKTSTEAKKSATVSATASPKPTDIPAPSDTPAPTEAPLQIMESKIGNIDLTQPYTISVPKETGDLSKYWQAVTFNIDDPHEVTETEFTPEELAEMNPHNITKDPNVALNIQTDNRRPGLVDIMVYIHSGYSFWGNELPGNFLRRLVRDNPDKTIGAQFSLEQNGNVTTLEIVDYKNVDQEVFNGKEVDGEVVGGAFANYTNDADPIKQNTRVFLRFDKVGIDINTAPYNGNEDLVTFVTCSGPLLPISEIEATRALVTAKVVSQN